jgi:hypothetical protein
MAIASEVNARSRRAALEVYAADNLQFIRDTMERAAAFTAVPGEGGVVIGVSALAAGWVARGYPLEKQFWIWLLEGILAAGLGMAALVSKSKRLSLPLSSRTAKRTLMSFATPVLAGVMLTVALYRADALTLFAGLWLLLYGVAVITGGAFSVRVVPLMGLCFLALGSLALVTPAAWGNWFMMIGFGGLHLVFGAVIARKHGG